MLIRRSADSSAGRRAEGAQRMDNIMTRKYRMTETARGVIKDFVLSCRHCMDRDTRRFIADVARAAGGYAGGYYNSRPVNQCLARIVAAVENYDAFPPAAVIESARRFVCNAEGDIC